jgi:hypothetical protein
MPHTPASSALATTPESTGDLLDPYLQDPQGTRDERMPEPPEPRGAGWKAIAISCPKTGCQGGVKPVTPRAHDGSRRYECNDPDCQYKVRRNFDYYDEV